jgi:hypothetical protein
MLKASNNITNIAGTDRDEAIKNMKLQNLAPVQTYESVRSLIKTGDILGVRGHSFFSDSIELLTGKHDPLAISHVGVAYWSDKGLWLAEELQGKGFTCSPMSQSVEAFLESGDKCFWLQSPTSVTSNQDAVYKLISTYRVKKSLDHYGYGTLPRVLVDEKINPTKIQSQEVCSTFAQECWESTGYVFKPTRLIPPQGFKSLVQGIVEIN